MKLITEGVKPSGPRREDESGNPEAMLPHQDVLDTAGEAAFDVSARLKTHSRTKTYKKNCSLENK